MKSFSVTDIGRKRKMNQDYVFATDSPIGGLDNLYIVADGMGGHNAGEYASAFSVEELKDLVVELGQAEIEIILHRALQEVNRRLRTVAASDSRYYGMGTTIVIATVRGGILYVANVGDSRLYLKKNRLRQITVDHSLVEEMVLAGTLDQKKARTHPDKNVITRAIGAEDTLEIDFFREKVSEGNIVLMCSDGLTNMVDDDDIAMIVKAGRDVVQIVEELIRVANHNGGKDNIAVVIIEPFADEVR